MHISENAFPFNFITLSNFLHWIEKEKPIKWKLPSPMIIIKCNFTWMQSISLMCIKYLLILTYASEILSSWGVNALYGHTHLYVNNLMQFSWGNWICLNFNRFQFQVKFNFMKFQSSEILTRIYVLIIIISAKSIETFEIYQS